MNEALKRTVLTDTILAILKKIVRKRSTLKLILFSAPKEAQFFADYFNAHREKRSELKSVILSIGDEAITSKAQIQDILYLKSPCADYVQQTIQTIRNIHTKQPTDGDIIAYMAVEEDITDAIRILNTENISNLNYFKLSQMKNERERVFFPTTKGKRNVIFTTELYQNSVTQDRISYVIDCGFMHLNWYEPAQNRNRQLIVPVCKYTAALRAKWRNKYRMAKVFRLYLKDDFQSLPERSVVEMRRSELCSMILYLKTLAVDNILRFDFPSAPPAKNILATLEILYILGALDESGQLTNPLGYFMSESPFSPNLSRCLFNSGKMRCSEEILIICCMLQVEPVFIITNNNMADRHKQVAKRSFEAAEGDLITLLNVYNAFIENAKSKDFCRKYYLNYYSLMRVHRLKEYLTATLLNKYKIQMNTITSTEEILKCICSGLFMNIAYLHPSGSYKALRCGSEVDVYIDRESSIIGASSVQPQPKYVLFCELWDKSNVYMRNVSVIKEEWLDELAPHYYKRK